MGFACLRNSAGRRWGGVARSFFLTVVLMSDELCSRCGHTRIAHIEPVDRPSVACHECWRAAAKEYQKTGNLGVLGVLCPGYLDPLAHALEVRFGAV